MQKIFFNFILILFLTGCVSMQASSSVLYQEYSKYQNSVNKNNVVEVAGNFFSPSLLGEDYRVNLGAVSQLLFKSYMVEEFSYHEKKNEQEGCLTINGYDEENAPLIFSLKYILNDGRWLIDNIHVVFVEHVKDFADSAKCPNEYPE